MKGSATEVDSGGNPPAETGNAAVPAEQADAAPRSGAGDARCARRDVSACCTSRHARHYWSVSFGGADFFGR